MKNVRLTLLLAACSLTFGAAPVAADHPPRPVKTETEARALAKHWANDAKLVGVAIGEVKSIRLVYAVDLVDADEPDQHANHLFIRKDDGFAALIYPAHNAPKLNREHQLGLDGLAGMGGMTGSGDASQTGRRVNSDVEARRHVETWLRSKGLGEQFGLEDVTSMNRVFVVDLYERKTHRLANQAIVRGVDGYVALVRPLKGGGRELPTLSGVRK